MAKGGKGLRTMPAPQRHRLRIAVKKLRYGLEFFAGLYPTRRTRRLIDALRAFQDSLGALNDIAVARRTAAGIAAGAPTSQVAFAAGLVAGLRAAGEADRLEAAAQEHKALKAVDRPW